MKSGRYAHFLWVMNMNAKTLTTKICDLIKPIVNAMGYDLWGCELLKNPGRFIVRIYIDSDNGVKLEDCRRVSKQVSAILDVENIILSRYDLEVSSPGMDRFLYTEDQYRKFVNSEVRIRLSVPMAGKRTYTGKIIEVIAGNVKVNTPEGVITIPIDSIEKTKIIPQFEG
jgi:ribosome maturation factor RimP